MGVMRFLLHPPSFSQRLIHPEQAYLGGMDGRIFPTKVEVHDGELLVRRPTSESGKLSIAWPVANFGHPVLTTASLRERDQPYDLALELARGRLSEIRESMAIWEQAGMVIPDAFRQAQREAFSLFAQASTSHGTKEEIAELATRSIEKSLVASNLLMDSYAVQRLANIRRTHHQTPGLLGCRMDDHLLSEADFPHFQQAFNSVSIPVNWMDVEAEEGNYHWDQIDRQVNFALDRRIIVRGGPLIDLSPNGLPVWLAPWAKDFQNLPSFVCDYIETVIARYQGRIRIWEISAYGNTGGALGLGEDFCLALVARTLEAAHRTDSDSQLFVRLDCPWGEYQRRGEHRLSPFQFVDALVRSNLGLSGVTLDLNIGYGAEACSARDLLSISKLLDFWSLLQVQIHVNVACPSSAGPDPRSNPRYGVVDRVWNAPWSEETQAEWMEQVIPILLAKPCVTGVFLNNFHDAAAHRYPHAGLISSAGRPKQMLTSWRRLLQY